VLIKCVFINLLTYLLINLLDISKLFLPLYFPNKTRTSQGWRQRLIGQGIEFLPAQPGRINNTIGSSVSAAVFVGTESPGLWGV